MIYDVYFMHATRPKVECGSQQGRVALLWGVLLEAVWYGKSGTVGKSQLKRNEHE
jgi:hypothetical protein